MKTKSHHTLPLERKIFTVIEAASLADCTPTEILQHAATGDISLCVEVPFDVAICSIDRISLALENTPQDSLQAKLLRDRVKYNAPVWNCEVDLLILSQEDCTKIARRGLYRQDLFAQAGRFDDYGDVIAVNPIQQNVADIPSRSIMNIPGQRLFTVTAKNDVKKTIGTVYRPKPSPVELKIDNILITSKQLNAFQRLDYKTLTKRTLNAPEADLEMPWLLKPGTLLPDYFSERMCRLFRTASRVWCKEYAQNQKYPSNNEIAKVLTEANDGIFSKTLASHAAIIIRPDYANGAPNKALQTTAGNFSPRFRALMQVAYYFFGSPANTAEKKKRPSHSTLAAHFGREPHNFPPYLAEAAASIIRYTPDAGGDDCP